MSEETKIKCDCCKKEIKDGHQKRYMIVLGIGYPYAYNDGGSIAAVDRESEIKHLHFECFKPVAKAFPWLVPKSLK
jgi:hypothetical protein